MDTIIRLKLSELNNSLIERIKALVQANENTEVTISVKDNSEYSQSLEKSIKNLDEGRDVISFTIEELEEYSMKHKQ